MGHQLILLCKEVGGCPNFDWDKNGEERFSVAKSL